MSVPVRYSAAANNFYVNNISDNSNATTNAGAFVVIDSGLSIEQEQQYHHNYEQLQLQHQHQQQLHFQALVEAQQQQLQQQLMQQRSTMSSSSSAQQQHQQSSSSNLTSSSSLLADPVSATMMPMMNPQVVLLNNDEQPTTSAAAAAAAAMAAANGNNNHNAMEIRNEWITTTGAAAGATTSPTTVNDNDEGRYGTPGAAGLEYQKYEQLQQQQQQLNENNSNPLLAPNGSGNGNQQMDTENMANNNGSKYNIQNVEAELHAMTAQEHYDHLKEYDVLQEKYHTVLNLPKEDKREVTAGGRDGSAYVLRCLKMWYELPSDVLFASMSLVDRFLDRMAVKPKHMACMSVASFYLAIKQLGLKSIPAEDLVTISQCGCTAGDLERMARVIANKLGVYKNQAPITAVNFLRCYYALFRIVAQDVGEPFFTFYQNYIKLEEMENRLEILLCDVRTTNVTPSVLALVLISLHLDFHIKESYTRGRPELKTIFEYILFLQQFMRIPDRVFTCGFSLVSGILSHYNGQNKQPYKQRLVWKLSSRTLRQLRPTNRLSSVLPTIEEGISNAMDDGCRSRTESLSSEEEEDWPTSPIIPIFEQC